MHTAMLMAQSANQQRTKRSDPVAFPREFMLGYKPPKKQHTARITALRNQIKSTQKSH